MGIREDVENGLCREEYILLPFAVEVIANHAGISKPEAARWLAKKEAHRVINVYFRDPRTGAMIQINRSLPPGAEYEGVKRILYLIETDRLLSGVGVELLYWYIPALTKWLNSFGEDIPEDTFAEAVTVALEKTKSNKRTAEPTQEDGKPGLVASLRARIAALETQLADSARKDQSKPAMEAANGQPSFRHVTDELKLVAAVQERYLGENWDPDDADTRPKKNDVVEWLKEQNPGMSNVAAEAIDRVAMPFNRSK